MAQRITRAHMDAQVSIVNGLLGYTDVTWRSDGAITLSGAYGGWAVHRYSGTSGGVSDLTGGHGTAREASTFLSGMIAALRIVKDSQL